MFAKMSYAYFVTALTEVKHLGHRDKKCFGWFRSLESAEEAIATRGASMVECRFDYLVIEQYPEGVEMLPVEKKWFKCDRPSFNAGGPLWKECDRPKSANGTICWAMP